MYRQTRTIHKLTGLIVAVFLILLGCTGFLLALKGQISWMRPPNRSGEKIQSPSEVITVDQAADAAFAIGITELQKWEDVERIDYRPNKNIFKILSNTGYHEVQVDGKTGAILSRSFRGDQLTEDLHDLSFFKEQLRVYALPIVAVGLVTLGVSGLVMYFVPIVRRKRFERSHRSNQTPGD